MNGYFWKSGLLWQIYGSEVIPEFYCPFKVFSVWNFAIRECFSLSQTYFYHKKVHIKWDVVISSLLGLLMKVLIWNRCQNWIENYYHHDGEQLGFYKKVHIKTKSKKKDVLVIFTLQKRNEFQFFNKNCTQENVQLHIQHGESWLRGIIIEQLNYK